MDFSVTQLLVIAMGGFVAGIVNGTIGGGSLLTYPVLVAMGVPPVFAAATNTTGLSPGNMAALIPHLDGKTVPIRDWYPQAAANAAGALVGGILLIALPDRVFEFVVPILLVFASLVTLRKPRAVGQQVAPHTSTLTRLFASGMYQGYFGPGQGVLAMAVLLHDGRLTVHQVVVIKNLVIAAGNVVVSLLFILSGHVVWAAALPLLIAVSAGGWSGARLSHLVRAEYLRYGVALVGVISAVWFVAAR